jgi:hypothetical protein
MNVACAAQSGQENVQSIPCCWLFHGAHDVPLYRQKTETESPSGPSELRRPHFPDPENPPVQKHEKTLYPASRCRPPGLSFWIQSTMDINQETLSSTFLV